MFGCLFSFLLSESLELPVEAPKFGSLAAAATFEFAWGFTRSMSPDLACPELLAFSFLTIEPVESR